MRNIHSCITFHTQSSKIIIIFLILCAFVLTACNKYEVKKISPEEYYKQNNITGGLKADPKLCFFITQNEGDFFANISKHSNSMFEIGTGRGDTTLLWAQHSPKDAKIFTLTLPRGSEEIKVTKTDNKDANRRAITELTTENFVYENTPYSHKITQLYADSKNFDETKYKDSIDMMFIDGAHTYSYVKSDTQKALAMVKKGGYIIWHDYKHKLPDVFKYLHELNKTLEIYNIEGTALVIYKKK
ncbi:MAG: class I SAM-dependent methyltransferase [bacterium]|nr:class I SAM-dependent methyltransferase [bacterium]